MEVFLKSTQINWRATTAGFLTVVSIIFGFNPTLSSYAFIAFLLALVTFLYDQDQRFTKRLKQTDDNAKQMSNDVKKHLQVIRLDKTAKTFDNYIIKRLDLIESIKNTSFNLKKGHEEADDKFNQSEALSNAPYKIKLAIENGLKWRDIGDDIEIDRFRKWKRICNCDSKIGLYEYKILNHVVPYPNFLIVTYKDGIEEVLFNWDHRGGNPTVLASRETELVEFYRNQFTLLSNAASEYADDSL